MCLALRAAAPCKSAILPICRTRRGTHQITSLRHIRKTPLAGRLAYVAERGGFEPPKRGLDAYTLSRRAPSTTRTPRSEEHTSELQSLMRISYAVFCLKKTKTYSTTEHR